MDDISKSLYQLNLLALGTIIVGTPIAFYGMYRFTVGKYKRKMERLFRRRGYELQKEFKALKGLINPEVDVFGGKVELEDYDAFAKSIHTGMQKLGYGIEESVVRRAVGHVRVGNLFNPGIRKKDVNCLARYLSGEFWLERKRGS